MNMINFTAHTVFSGPLGTPKIPKMTRNQGVHPMVQCAFSMNVTRYNDTEKQNSKMRLYELANLQLKTGQPQSPNTVNVKCSQQPALASPVSPSIQ
jgi:hypothetical protein